MTSWYLVSIKIVFINNVRLDFRISPPLLAGFSFRVYMHVNVTGEKMEMTFFPDQGSNPVRWTKSYTLPRHYKSRLVLQGSTSVSYTYTRCKPEVVSSILTGGSIVTSGSYFLANLGMIHHKGKASLILIILIYVRCVTIIIAWYGLHR